MKKFFIITLCVVCLCLIAILTKTNNGRYQIIMHPTYRTDQYLLDTKTGHVWHLVEGKDKLLLWEPMLKTNPSVDELVGEQDK